MNPLLKYGAAVAIVLGALYGAYSHGVTVTTAKYETVIAKADQDHANELASKIAEARQAEQVAAANASAIDKQTIQEKTNEIASRDATIAAFNDGTVRLRDRFTCSAGASAGVPKAATSTGQRDGASAGGLQRQDVEFLVSEASRANQYAKQLMACQALVNADRGVK